MKKLILALLMVAIASVSCSTTSVRSPEEESLQKERVNQLRHPIYSPW